MNVKLPSNQLIAEYLDWATKNIPNTSKINTSKLLEEAYELANEPHDAEEMADVLMVLIYQIHLTKVDVVEAFRAKLTKNRARTWTRNGNGTWKGSKVSEADVERHRLISKIRQMSKEASHAGPLVSPREFLETLAVALDHPADDPLKPDAFKLPSITKA